MNGLWLVGLAACIGTATGTAQGVPDFVAAGRAAAASEPAVALGFFEQALAIDSLDYEANWRAAVASVDLGQDPSDAMRTRARDSLYSQGERYARRAIRTDSTDVNGLFALAMALGRTAQTKGTRARLAYVEEIHSAANRALALEPDHDGVHHVLGLWNAEIMRTSGIGRFMARNMLGAKVLGQASWDNAIHHLERAVAIDSTRVYHRLDLARVYTARKRYADARTQLLAAARLPERVWLDARYQAEAAALLAEIADRAAAESRRANGRTE